MNVPSKAKKLLILTIFVIFLDFLTMLRIRIVRNMGRYDVRALDEAIGGGWKR